MKNKKYALITVSDRRGLLPFAAALKTLDFEIITSKRTTQFLRKHGLEVTEVPEITGYQPIIGKQGIKLIHPKIFGAILADENKREHQEDLKKYNINPFKLVVCNFYPFEKTISKKDFQHETAMYNLDIGGPAMVRCAAKNYNNVTVITAPEDYEMVLGELKSKGDVPLEIRKSLSLKAFRYVHNYDELIITYLSSAFEVKACKNCLNTTKNPTMTINEEGLCRICELYKNNFDKKILDKELKFLKSFIGSSKSKYDLMVGISGGKDSTAMLHTIKQMGFNPLAFNFDIGYYPKHIFSRSTQVAKKLSIDHEIIDIRKYIRENDRKSYQMTAELYDRGNLQEFQERYLIGRKHYSVKCKHSVAFVRTCQLCRHTVIPAYYAEALKRGVKVVVLGINEWAGLSQKRDSEKYTISAIRKLQPFPDKPAIYIVHLPFLLQRTSKDTLNILKKLGWKIPCREDFIESNSNSCLFARAAENKARELLGFHPDSTRLSREVTVGFITREQARKALSKNHLYKYSVREVLQRAKIIN